MVSRLGQMAGFLGVCVFSLAVLGGCGSRSEEITGEAPADLSGSTDAAAPADNTAENTGAVPPPPPAESFLAQIPPDIAGELTALEIPIMVPTYLPAGFDLVDYEAGTAEAGAGEGPYYWLVYRDDIQRCFSIEYTSGGIGGPSLDNALPIDSPLFGADYSLYYGQFDNADLSAEFPEEDLFSDWLQGDQGFYRLIGAQLTMQTYDQKRCQDLPPEDAVKVVESLTDLQGDVFGGG